MSTAAGSAPPSPSAPPPTSPAVWIALILLTAAMVAATAGLLAYAGGMSVPASLLTAGGAFAGTCVLLLTILKFALNMPS